MKKSKKIKGVKSVPKKPVKQKLAKKNSTTSLNLALANLRKEAKKSNGILDKTKPSVKLPKKTIVINSSIILKRNTKRFEFFLQQRMFHQLAAKVQKVHKLIEDNMSQNGMRDIVNTLNDIGYEHGYDIGKN